MYEEILRQATGNRPVAGYAAAVPWPRGEGDGGEYGGDVMKWGFRKLRKRRKGRKWLMCLRFRSEHRKVRKERKMIQESGQ